MAEAPPRSGEFDPRQLWLTRSITSLPDNTQLNMTYTDPTTGKNETCWEYCPLYTDSSIGAQDFVFTAGTRSMTGLQMQLKGWIGNGAALSSVQLLSDGECGCLRCNADPRRIRFGRHLSEHWRLFWIVPVVRANHWRLDKPHHQHRHPCHTGFLHLVDRAGV
jgi:hypothetical protein